MKVTGTNTVLAGAVACVLVAAHAVADSGDHRFTSGVEKAKRATVGILQDSQNARGQRGKANFALKGSGFHVRDGYIVTARHAVERDEAGQKVVPKEITLLTTDLDELPAELTGVNEFLDVAVYRIEKEVPASLKAAAFGDKEPEAGDELFTVGYPLGWGPAVGFGRLGNANVFLPTVDSRLFQIESVRLQRQLRRRALQPGRRGGGRRPRDYPDGDHPRRAAMQPVRVCGAG